MYEDDEDFLASVLNPELNAQDLYNTFMETEKEQLRTEITRLNRITPGLDFYFFYNHDNILHRLAAQPSFASWDTVIDSFVYLNCQNDQQQTPLHIAILNKNMLAVKCLVENGASLSVIDIEGNSPSSLVCDDSLLDYFKELQKSIEAQFCFKDDFNRLGRISIQNNSIQVLGKLLAFVGREVYTKYDEDGYNLLHFAITQGKLEPLKVLIKYGFDPNAVTKAPSKIMTPLELTNEPNIIEFLLVNGTQNKGIFKSPLVKEAQVRISKWMDSAVFFGQTELHKAAKEGNIKYLNKYKGKIDILNVDGLTPLACAVESCREDAVSILLSKNADPTLLGSASAFHIAARMNNIRMFHILTTKKPPNVDEKDSNDMTVITYSIHLNSVELLSEILNQKPSFSSTFPLIVKSLLSIGNEERVVNTFCLLHPFFGQKELLELTIGFVQRDFKGIAEPLIKETNFSLEELEELLKTAEEIESPLFGTILDKGITPPLSMFYKTATHQTSTIFDCFFERKDRFALEDKGNIYLNHAIAAHNKRAIQDAIQKLGNDPFELNYMQQSIFHTAAETGYTELFANDEYYRLLDSKDLNNLTPLEVALRHRQLETADFISKIKQHPIFDDPVTQQTIDYLRTRDLSPDVKSSDMLPLISKLIDENPPNVCDLIEQLIAMGCNLSLADKEEKIPVHHAIDQNNLDVVKLIVEHGCDFFIGRALNAYADEKNAKEIYAFLKQPNAWASAIEDLGNNQKLVAEKIADMVDLFKANLFNLPSIPPFANSSFQIMRILRLFSSRIYAILPTISPTSPISYILLYFIDALHEHTSVPSLYGRAKREIKMEDNRDEIFGLKGKKNTGSLGQNMFASVRALINHKDMVVKMGDIVVKENQDYSGIQKAVLKYSNLGRDVDYAQLVFKSQKKLATHRLVVKLRNESHEFKPNDVLLTEKGIFRRISIFDAKPSSSTAKIERVDEIDWGLRLQSETIGNWKGSTFVHVGRSMESFFKNNQIAVLLFKNVVLFGLMKGETKFKLKASWLSNEVIFDFSEEYFVDGFAIWTPMGFIHVQFDKTTDGAFLKDNWRKAVQEVDLIKQEDEQTKDGFEVCITTWVSPDTNSVLSRPFVVQCSSKTEAKAKILQQLMSKSIPIKKSSDGSPLIHYKFVTAPRPKDDTYNIIANIELNGTILPAPSIKHQQAS